MSLFNNVIVTGASRGLGLEFVKQLASKKTCQKVVASCRDPESANDLLQLQQNYAEKIHVKRLDVNEFDTFSDFANEAGVSCDLCYPDFTYLDRYVNPEVTLLYTTGSPP